MKESKKYTYSSSKEENEKLKNPNHDFDVFTKKVESFSRQNHEKSFEDLHPQEQQKVVDNVLSTHKEEHNTTQEYTKLSKKAEEVISNLSPDEDNKKIKELIFLTQETGIVNTLEAIEKTESPHVRDDFHKFLVQYLNAGYPIKNLSEQAEIYKGLNMVLYSIQLPEKGEEKDEQKDMQTLLASMEQFYAGMISSVHSDTKTKTKRHFSIEIALAEDTDQVMFYCAVPTDNKNIFKNNILSIFPFAQIKEATDDYNVFNKKDDIAMSIVDYKREDVFPIKTYDEITYDPLNIILQSFNNLEKEEGASIQILMSPADDSIYEKIEKASGAITSGDNISSSIKKIKEHKIIKAVNDVVKFFATKKEKGEIKDSDKRQLVVEELKKKKASQLFNTNIRIVASGNNQAHAKAILYEIEAAFHQFTSTTGNSFKFNHLEGKLLKLEIRRFIFRIFNHAKAKLLNTKELTSLVHFPKTSLGVKGILSSSNLTTADIGAVVESVSKETKEEIANVKKNNTSVSEDNAMEEYQKASQEILNQQKESQELKSKKINTGESEKIEVLKSDHEDKSEILPTSDNAEVEFKPRQEVNLKEVFKKSGDNLQVIPEFDDETLVPGKILVGFNEHQGEKTKIYMKELDRMRHFYLVGQTGTGKTTIMKNMIMQDIRKGEGVCFIDPHGSDIEDIIANIPPERYDDLVYFDPAATEMPYGLNMLEYDPAKPEQKSFVVDEMMAIFGKLFDMKSSGGPMFEMYFRQAVLLVIDEPGNGATLMEVTRVFADKQFRDEKIRNCKNIVVKEFWDKIANKAGGDASLENVTPYITSKFDNFLANDYMRPIVAQEKTTLDFKDIMDNKKILIVNLSKGRLGELNSSLIGMIVVGKILLTALGRVDMKKEDRNPFYLYIDEFQNITTDSISQILSEARKYALSLNVAHQFIKQLEDNIKDAIFGNVGTIIAYRVGTEDAEMLEKIFAPTFVAKNLSDLPNFNGFIRPLVNNSPVKPFNIQAYRDPPGDRTIVKDLMNLSFVKYGRKRAQVEWEINQKFANLR